MDCEKYVNALQKKVKELNIKGAVIGLSGGKDSNIVAKLMVNVLGKENVIGVMIPNGGENDFLAIELSKLLGINTLSCDIADAFKDMTNNLNKALQRPAIENLTYGQRHVSNDASINLAPRLRMVTLYAIAQSMGSGWRVIGTTNKSENYIGWVTKWGDGGADFEPIINLSVSDLHELGPYIALPAKFVFRTPVDGLTPKTDEERFGFTYDQLDQYMEKGTSGDKDIDIKIKKMHLYSQHKRESIPDVLI